MEKYISQGDKSQRNIPPPGCPRKMPGEGEPDIANQARESTGEKGGQESEERMQLGH